MTLRTPDELARFLAGMGYPRAEVAEAVRNDFPDRFPEYVERVVDDAFTAAGTWDEGLDREVRKEQDAAIAAEHDEGEK